jgi:hypothetical protein
MAFVVYGTRLQFIPKWTHHLIHTTAQRRRAWDIHNEGPSKFFVIKGVALVRPKFKTLVEWPHENGCAIVQFNVQIGSGRV